MGLAILDRPPSSSTTVPGGPVWRTCLREVWFGRSDDIPSGVADALTHADAYARLLEIICGLQSPLVGETQVLGQFKIFLGGLDDSAAWLQPIGQRLLTDARAIRSRHLQDLGSRTYGSAVRRYVADCVVVALVGGGALAQEILPFLTPRHRIDLWTRRLLAIAGPTNHHLLSNWQDVAVDRISSAGLVIAAPIPDDALAQVASRYDHLLRLVDLRADAEAASAGPAIDVPQRVTLAQLFADKAAAEFAAAGQLSAARAEIQLRARQFDRAELVRPFGWDDLCA